MNRAALDILEAPRLPALCRGICLYAGFPLPPASAPGERFVVRSGVEPPELLAHLLQEAFVDDGIEVGVGPTPAKVTVLPGQRTACPDGEELCRAVSGGGAVMLFAVERLNEAGRVLGVTWAAVPEEEPAPQGRFRAAIRSYECDPPV